MLSMKSVASALVLAATAADLAAPVLVAPALVLGLSTVAHAAPAETIVRRQVLNYADLNLATPSGKATFNTRLRGAAETVCGPDTGSRSLDEVADYKACMAKAVQDALSAVPDMRQQASQPNHAG